MNRVTALWSEKFLDQFKANSNMGLLFKVNELRGIAYSVAGWATRRLFDAESVELVRIVVRPR